MKKCLLTLAAPGVASVLAGIDQNVQNDAPVLLPLTNLAWRCGANARIENGILTVDVPPEKAEQGGSAWADVDLAPYRGHGVRMTFHAFREWAGWSVEHVGTNVRDLHPSSDNPRKRALLEGLRKGIK